MVALKRHVINFRAGILHIIYSIFFLRINVKDSTSAKEKQKRWAISGPIHTEKKANVNAMSFLKVHSQ